MQYLKADTNVEILIGPAVAVGDGFTPVTTLSLSAADEAEIIKHNGATALTVTSISANTIAAITGADGYYTLDITTGNTDTEGPLTILINDDSLILPIRQDYMVVNANVYDSLFAAATTDYLQVDTLQLGGGTQSATDLKDFADAGYDPATNKVQGVVLADTVTTLTGHTAQTGDTYALANGATGFAAIDTVVDTINTNVGTAGAGLTNIPTIATVTNLTNERGKYANGAVWIGPTANTNTTSYVDGIITNPVSTVAAAKTIADALGLRKFYTVRTGASQIADAITGYEFDGADWSVTTTGGSRDVGTSEFLNAQVIGGTFAATTGTIIWENCRFTAAISAGPSVMRECLFRNTLTLTDAGNYDFVDCASSIPGAASPTFALGTGAMNIGFRNWSGGITMTGISSDDVITLDGSFGGITLEGADGTVDIRGTYKSITDNRTGSPTLTITGAMIPSDLAGVLVDTGTTLPATLTTIDGKVDTVDTVVDGIQTDLDNATDGLGAIKTDTAAVKTVTDQMVFTKANELDVNTQSINGAAVVGDGNATPWDGA